MPDSREVIIEFIKSNGPILPVQLSKHINTNILFASAMLSELVSTRQLKMTTMAIGGSPLYYAPGQEELVDQRLGGSLGGREKEVYLLLKDKRILWEKDLLPWQRVALRDLKDFAALMSVKHNDNIENFWKHNIVNDNEARQTISKAFDEILESNKVPEIVTEINKKEQVVQTTLEAPIIKPIILQSNIRAEIKTLNPEIEETQEVLVKSKTEKVKKKETKIDTQFYNTILEFMKSHQVAILKEEIIKKGREFDFVVNINTGFGKLKYLVRAKSKPSINEADISLAFSEGQIKKMPVIFLTDGKTTKKAALLVEQKMQGQLTVKEL